MCVELLLLSKVDRVVLRPKVRAAVQHAPILEERVELVPEVVVVGDRSAGSFERFRPPRSLAGPRPAPSGGSVGSETRLLAARGGAWSRKVDRSGGSPPPGSTPRCLLRCRSRRGGTPRRRRARRGPEHRPQRTGMLDASVNRVGLRVGVPGAAVPEANGEVPWPVVGEHRFEEAPARLDRRVGGHGSC